MCGTAARPASAAAARAGRRAGGGAAARCWTRATRSRPWSRSPSWASWCCCTRAWRPACRSPTLNPRPRPAAPPRCAVAAPCRLGARRAAARCCMVVGRGGAPGRCGACCGITGHWPAARVKLLRARTALRLPSRRGGVRCVTARRLPLALLYAALSSGAGPGWPVAGCEQSGAVWCTGALSPQSAGATLQWAATKHAILGSCAGT